MVADAAPLPSLRGAFSRFPADLELESYAPTWLVNNNNKIGWSLVHHAYECKVLGTRLHVRERYPTFPYSAIRDRYGPRLHLRSAVAVSADASAPSPPPHVL